ncbi:MAG: Bax inhibitor-1/YccA family protein, partial [Gemmatimonas sp.]|uniref:Bax inhibitor-1/YccA family membrane protein n=1 Tax=Gemmatimonas sp. TaxID=1962908 RepID=UPI00391B8CDD
MRTNNPVLSRFADTARETFGLGSPGAMTVAGTAGKAMLLLAVVVFSATMTWQQVAGGRPELVMPAMLVGGLGGFVFALVTSFRPQWAPWTAPIYASLEGILLGAISALYNTRFAGLPQQAVLLTFGVAAGVLVLYRLRILRATAGFKRMMLGAVIGIGLFYL